MQAALNKCLTDIKKTIGVPVQRSAGMRAAVDIAVDSAVPADQKSGQAVGADEQLDFPALVFLQFAILAQGCGCWHVVRLPVSSDCFE